MEFLGSINRWLRSEPAGVKATIEFLRDALLTKFAWVVVMSIIATWFNYVPDSHNTLDLQDALGEFSLSVLTAILMASAAIEELLFRTAPLFFGWAVAWVFWRNECELAQTSVLLGISIVASAVFGYVHGNFSSIPVQGVGGFILSIVYLKCGGINGKIMWPLMTSASVHFVFNMILVIGVVLLSAPSAGD